MDQDLRGCRPHHDQARPGARPLAGRGAGGPPSAAAQLLPPGGKSTVVAMLAPSEAPCTKELLSCCCRAATASRRSCSASSAASTAASLPPSTSARRRTSWSWSDQRQPHRLPAVPGGHDPRLLRRQPAGHRRGRPRPRRPVPRRPAHAGRLGRPADLPVHALRQARLLLRRLGQRRRRLAAASRSRPTRCRASRRSSWRRSAAAWRLLVPPGIRLLVRGAGGPGLSDWSCPAWGN